MENNLGNYIELITFVKIPLSEKLEIHFHFQNTLENSKPEVGKNINYVMKIQSV